MVDRDDGTTEGARRAAVAQLIIAEQKALIDHLEAVGRDTAGAERLLRSFEHQFTEAAETHYARAKDRTNLLKAIQEKLKAIREFVLWWDRLEKAQGARTDLEPRDSAVTKFIAGRNGMPERKVIERWRKRTKDEKVFLQALEDAEYRCARICELEKAATVRGSVRRFRSCSS